MILHDRVRNVLNTTTNSRVPAITLYSLGAAFKDFTDVDITANYVYAVCGAYLNRQTANYHMDAVFEMVTNIDPFTHLEGVRSFLDANLYV